MCVTVCLFVYNWAVDAAYEDQTKSNLMAKAFFQRRAICFEWMNFTESAKW